MFRILLLLAVLAPMPCYAEFRDPTQPAYPLPSATADDTASDTALVLSAIWISPHSRRATINGISAKQGQTIVIGQTPALKPASAMLANSGDTDSKSRKQRNKPREYVEEHSDSPLGKVLAPLSASGSLNAFQTSKQSAAMAETNTHQQPDTVHQARSNTIKIISIRKNSVIVNQNGEVKTLQLVQRPYQTINSKYTQK